MEIIEIIKWILFGEQGVIWSIAPAVGAALIGAGGALVGSVWDDITGKTKQEKQLQWQQEENRKAAEETYQYGEAAADRAQKRGWETYERYQSPAALRKQYQEAGLSEGLLYGGGGAGGAGGHVSQGNQGSGATRQPANAREAAMTQQQAQSNAIQAAMALSQIKLQNAQAAKTEAEGRTIEQQFEYFNEVKSDRAHSEKMNAYIQTNTNAILDYQKTMAEYNATGVNRNIDENGNEVASPHMRQKEQFILGEQIKNALMRETKRGYKIENDVAEKNAKKLSDLMVDLANKQITVEEYAGKLAQWKYDNRWYLRAWDSGDKIINAGTGFFIGKGVGKATGQAGSRGSQIAPQFNPW